MDSLPIILIQKNVVLVGAGNAHLRFVKMFGMHPVAGVAVTLVSEGPVIPYSAMVPGHIGGDYTWDDITIDLVRLCRASGVRLVSEAATAIDAGRRKVAFACRPELSYDVLSLGLGSLPACPPNLLDQPASWLMRPLERLIGRLDVLEKQLRQAPRPFHLVVVGGGASGCELTLAIHKRLAGVQGFRLTLLQSQPRLLPQFPAKAGQIFTDLLQQPGITLRVSAQVTRGDDRALVLNNGEHLEFDTVLWATNAAPHPLLKTSGLTLSEDGFLQVHDTLQSVGDPAVFGTGDCISIDCNPSLLKNGVYAVREGGVLFDNVARFLHEQPLTRFRPQRNCLCLMNASDGSAVFIYGPLVWKGSLVRRLKDRIDRAWIDKFTRLAPMTGPSVEQEDSSQMRCGGCGSKISSDVLSAVLKRIDVGDDPRILLGCRAGEDASVHRMKPGLFGQDADHLVEVQTVDYFKSFVDDPYLFGRIAALHAVSDLYAMNARPFLALAIATLPYARGPVQEAMLYELLSGAVHTFRQLGVTLTGGHTVEGAELALGFSVTGYAEEDRLFQKSKLRPSDVLILTKPIGSGALLAAWMRGQCRAEWFNKLIQGLLMPNDRAAQVFVQHGVQACTDVTGFGLAGHLLEMLDASRVDARLTAGKVPLYQGFAEVVQSGIVSTLQKDNAKVACRVQDTAVPPAWLFDPQTAGGMLAAVEPEQVDPLLRALADAGYKEAAMIGEVIPASGTGPSMIHLS